MALHWLFTCMFSNLEMFKLYLKQPDLALKFIMKTTGLLNFLKSLIFENLTGANSHLSLLSVVCYLKEKGFVSHLTSNTSDLFSGLF